MEADVAATGDDRTPGRKKTEDCAFAPQITSISDTGTSGRPHINRSRANGFFGLRAGTGRKETELSSARAGT